MLAAEATSPAAIDQLAEDVQRHSAMLQARTAVLCAAEAGREYATQAGGTSAVWLPVSAARAYAALGNAEQAKAATTEHYALRTVQAYSDRYDPAWAFGDRAGSHTNLAIARITNGELDAAADALAPVLDLPAEQRINGIMHSVRRVHQALTRAGHANDARDLIDGIEHFTHTPANALPR